jgi:ERCC4-type nuclease
MILVDSRTGSKELFPLFPKGQAKLTTLPFADFSFVGNGPEGMPINIGIERKTIREIAGTLSDGRLVGHQVPGLVKEYGVVYLVVEGRWRGESRTGILQVKTSPVWDYVQNGQARFMADAIRKFLSTLENMAGVRLRYTENKNATVQEVMALHSWWVDKEWEEHQAHIAIQYPPIDTLMFRKPSVLQYMAACLPGIGWKRSKAVEAHFPGIINMVLSDEKEWQKVEGIGKGVAKKVVETLNWRRG